jgi:hypothetical protein
MLIQQCAIVASKACKIRQNNHKATDKTITRQGKAKPRRPSYKNTGQSQEKTLTSPRPRQDKHQQQGKRITKDRQADS